VNFSGEVTATDEMIKGFGKNIFDNIEIKNNVKVELFDEFGNLKECREVHNATTVKGKYIIADQLLDSPTIAKPGWMEIGTGVPGDTLLGAYAPGSRSAISTKTRNNNVVTMVCTFAAGAGTGVIIEAGVFNTAEENAEIMLASASFAVVTKTAVDTLTITWAITIN